MSEDFSRNGGKIAENRALTDVNRVDAISGLMVDFLRLIDVNAGGLRLKKGQGILHLEFCIDFWASWQRIKATFCRQRASPELFAGQDALKIAEIWFTDRRRSGKCFSGRLQVSNRKTMCMCEIGMAAALGSHPQCEFCWEHPKNPNSATSQWACSKKLVVRRRSIWFELVS